MNYDSSVLISPLIYKKDNTIVHHPFSLPEGKKKNQLNPPLPNIIQIFIWIYQTQHSDARLDLQTHPKTATFRITMVSCSPRVLH